MKESPEQWLSFAEDDLAFAELGLANGYYAQVCFLAQQASEKSLKALLIGKTGSHPRLHSLVELASRCAEEVPDALKLEDTARILDQYYIPSRYPDGVPGGVAASAPTESHAGEALEGAKMIHAFCRVQLP